MGVMISTERKPIATFLIMTAAVPVNVVRGIAVPGVVIVVMSAAAVMRVMAWVVVPNVAIIEVAAARSVDMVVIQIDIDLDLRLVLDDDLVGVDDDIAVGDRKVVAIEHDFLFPNGQITQAAGGRFAIECRQQHGRSCRFQSFVGGTKGRQFFAGVAGPRIGQRLLQHATRFGDSTCQAGVGRNGFQ